MRIFLLAPSYQPNPNACGIGHYSQRLVEHLREVDGVDVSVICEREYLGSDQKIFRVDLLKRWKGVKIVSRLLDTERPDILLVQYSPPLYGEHLPWVTLLPVIRTHKPVPKIVFSLHTLYGNFWSRIMIAGALGAADGIISTNEEIDLLLSRKMKRLTSKTVSIPIGSNILRPDGIGGKEAARERLGLPRDKFLLIYFGLFYPGKNIETLLESVKFLRATRTDFSLVLCGSPFSLAPDYYHSLRQLGSKLGLDDETCIWTGALSDEKTAEYLLAADLYINPSPAGITNRNGSAMAAVEFGLPVVAARRDHRPSRFFRENEHYLGCDMTSPESLAGTIDQVLSDPSLKKKLSAGISLLRKNVSWSGIASDHVRFLRSRLV